MTPQHKSRQRDAITGSVPDDRRPLPLPGNHRPLQSPSSPRSAEVGLCIRKIKVINCYCTPFANAAAKRVQFLSLIYPASQTSGDVGHVYSWQRTHALNEFEILKSDWYTQHTFPYSFLAFFVTLLPRKFCRNRLGSTCITYCGTEAPCLRFYETTVLRIQTSGGSRNTRVRIQVFPFACNRLGTIASAPYKHERS